MKGSISNPSLSFRVLNKKLIGVTGNYVDNDLIVGNSEIQFGSELKLNMFDSRLRKYDNFKLFGKLVITLTPAEFTFTQPHNGALRILRINCNLE